jgi:foldase protein PrsA
MRKTGKRLAAAVLAIALAMSAAGCQIGQEEVTITRGLSGNTVFSIGGKTCTLGVMKLLLMNNMNLHGESYGIDLLTNDNLKVQKKFEQYVKSITMDEITRIYSMAALASDQGLELDEDEKEMVDWAGEDCYRSLSDEERDMLDITQDEITQVYEKYALSNLVYRTLVQDVNQEVSDDEARVMEIRQIFTVDESRAKAALAELEGEAEFSSVAANYNEADEISLTLMRGQLPEQAEQAAFAMDNGEISDIVETDEGYYIFYCENKFEEELTQEHKDDIVEQRRQTAFDSVYEPFAESLRSQLNQNAWDSISVRDMENCSFSDFYRIYDKYLSTL